MNRVRLYATPHKGIRIALASLSARLGSTDFADPAELSVLQEEAASMFSLLDKHTAVEEKYLLQNLAFKMEGATERDQHEHEELEDAQREVAARIAALTGAESADELHELYLDFSQFHSRYLAHIWQEEKVTEKLLQHYFTDEDLLQIHFSIARDMSPEDLFFSVKYFAPGLNRQEKKQVFDGLCRLLPQQYQPWLESILNPAPAEKVL